MSQPTSKIDIFTHILPVRYREKLLKIAPPGLDIVVNVDSTPTVLTWRSVQDHGQVRRASGVLTCPRPRWSRLQTRSRQWISRGWRMMHGRTRQQIPGPLRGRCGRPADETTWTKPSWSWTGRSRILAERSSRC